MNVPARRFSGSKKFGSTLVSNRALRTAIMGCAPFLPMAALADETTFASWNLPSASEYSLPLTYTVRYYATGATGSIIDPSTNDTINLTLSGEVLKDTSTSSGTGWRTSGIYAAGSDFNSTFISTASPTAPVQGATRMILESGFTAPAYKAHTLTFSQPVSNAVFLISSLGAPGSTSAYRFTQPFQILSQNGYLTATGDATSGYTLSGREGMGVIQFLGTYSSISWTVTVPELFSGFTVGLTTASNPDASQPKDKYTFGDGLLPPPYAPVPDIISSNNGQSGFNTLSGVGNGKFKNRFAGGTLVVDRAGSTRASPQTISGFFYIAEGANQAL